MLLGMHPPGWRCQIQGADAASAQWNAIIDQFEDFRVTWVRATPTEGGVIVEWEMHTGHGDTEHLCRQVDILHGDGAEITEHESDVSALFVAFGAVALLVLRAGG